MWLCACLRGVLRLCEQPRAAAIVAAGQCFLAGQPPPCRSVAAQAALIPLRANPTLCQTTLAPSWLPVAESTTRVPDKPSQANTAHAVLGRPSL